MKKSKSDNKLTLQSSFEKTVLFTKLTKLAKNESYKKHYGTFAGLILLISTSVWTILGAKYNLNNADHLVNAQLFENFSVFNQSILPGAHTFLLKWPVFLAIRLLGANPFAYFILTYIIVLLTVGSLAYIIYRIDRRPYVFPTIWLALASVLMMIPIAPYAGALLPVGMAMIATRNIEYILFIVSILLLLKDRSLKSKWFWLGTLLLSILIVSDKLFMILAIGSAVLGLLIYAKAGNWKLTSFNIDWLSSALFAVIFGFGWIFLFSLGLVNISNESSSSPYNIITSVKDLFLGSFYALSGLFTNFGANPGTGTIFLSKYPKVFIDNFFSIGLLAYLTNALIAIAGLALSYKLVLLSFNKKVASRLTKNIFSVLSIALLLASLTALLSFMFTKHYYVVDARYLGIALFAVFIASTTYIARMKQLNNSYLTLIGFIFILSTLFGAIYQLQGFSSYYDQVSVINNRSRAIAQILANHRVNYLVGDYWRVVPAKLASANQVNISPLQTCTQSRDVLTSKKWQPDLRNRSFAYLLSVDGGNLTDFPNCTLKQIINVYGKPNSSVLVDGTISNPKEYLLFYDRGINKSSKNFDSQDVRENIIKPLTVKDLGNTTCSYPSTLNIVAHQDDDLLFMNPDILNSIKQGNCVRTIYVTAGDSGSGKYYYLSRQKGAQAAYSEMLGIKDDWTQNVVKLDNNQYVTISQPKVNKKVSLVFLNLPDGNLRGEGFPASDHQSLAKLSNGRAKLLISLDGQSSYTRDQLIDTLEQLMSLYQPTSIRTQAIDVGSNYHDHSDHVSVGNFAKQAYKNYELKQFGDQVKIPIVFYVGYPTHELEANVSGDELTQKQAAFLAYAKYDGSVCSSLEECLQTPTYGSYLSRQYQNQQ